MRENLALLPSERANGFAVPRMLPVKVGTHVRMLTLEDIVQVHAAGNYADIALVDGVIVHTKETISHIAQRLPLAKFVRIQRSIIVNRRCVREIQSRQNNYEFTLINGVRVLSGVTFRGLVREQFLTNLKRGARSSRSTAAARAVHGPEPRRSKLALAARSLVRRCAPGDEYQLAQLGTTTFLETYGGVFADEDILMHCVTHDSPGIYRAWLEDDGARVWIAEMETCHLPVGYLVLTPPKVPYSGLRAGDMQIQRLYVLKYFHGGGSGRQLLTMALQQARESGGRRLLLGDYRDNESARRFFSRAGFRLLGEYPCHVGTRDYPDVVFGLDL